MRTSKKALISAICLLCCVAILSVVIIGPWSAMDAAYYSDSSLRKDLAGTIDTIVLGASHALAAFDPNIIDETLGCTSYNLSGSLMTSHSKLYLLNKELARNPVDTVVLEVSYNTLIRTTEEEYGEGDAVTVVRLDSLPEKLAFLVKYDSLDDWMNIYSRIMEGGLVCWKNIIRGTAKSGVNRAAKGYTSKQSIDVTIPPEEVAELHDSRIVDMNYTESEVDALREQIEACHRKGIDVMIAVTPVSDRILWRERGWDEFRVWLENFSRENGCVCCDFNLLKNRYELFNDAESFYDTVHLSKSASESFSHIFSDVLKRMKAGEDVSDMFYDTYDQMLEDSPYMQYLH